jgi:hypothetical protein
MLLVCCSSNLCSMKFIHNRMAEREAEAERIEAQMAEVGGVMNAATGRAGGTDRTGPRDRGVTRVGHPLGGALGVLEMRRVDPSGAQAGGHGPPSG